VLCYGRRSGCRRGWSVIERGNALAGAAPASAGRLSTSPASAGCVPPSPASAGEGWGEGETQPASHARLAGSCPAASHFSCLAKKSNQKKACPLQRPFGLPYAARMLRAAEKNSLRSNIFQPKPPHHARCSGAVEGCPAPRPVFKQIFSRMKAVLVITRNIHAPFQPILPQNPHKVCAMQGIIQ
jgi:hypothetical protein